MDHKSLSQSNDQSLSTSSYHKVRIDQLKEEIAALRSENQRLKQLITLMSKRQQQAEKQLNELQQFSDIINKHFDESKERQEKIIKHQQESAKRQKEILRIQKETNQMNQLIHQSLSFSLFTSIKTTFNLFTHLYKKITKKKK